MNHTCGNIVLIKSLGGVSLNLNIILYLLFAILNLVEDILVHVGLL